MTLAAPDRGVAVRDDFEAFRVGRPRVCGISLAPPRAATGAR